MLTFQGMYKMKGERERALSASLYNST